MSHLRARNLRSRILNFLIFALMVPLAFSGCGKKADVKTQTSELEKAFPGAAAAAPAAQTEISTSAQAAPTDAKAYVSAALSAVQNNDYAGSVIALEKVQRMPG